MTNEEMPDFVRGSQLLEGSWRCARELHAGADAPAERDLEHPETVACLLSAEGFDEDVVAAALLHEAVEETDLEVDDIRRRFGEEVGELVAAMTEDPDIDSYPRRKQEHRDRSAADAARPRSTSPTSSPPRAA